MYDRGRPRVPAHPAPLNAVIVSEQLSPAPSDIETQPNVTAAVQRVLATMPANSGDPASTMYTAIELFAGI